ncbi:MAG TPA: S8 family peptidase [Gemmataceae bacterium]|nr:S8 family peptidase [Gemmataceae bacterium]
MKSLEASNRGIELLNVRQERGATLATVFIPYGRVNYFTSKFEQYLTEHVRGGSQPKNQKLVESISEIRRAVLESFWTDATEVLPRPGQAIWWEVWLRTPSASEVGSNIFRSEANRIGLSVGPRQISFPDRTVLIAFGTREQLAESVELLDVVAELRRAKECPTAFIETTPREQTDWVTSVLTRLTAAPASANAVCVLDTGVNIGHPLLAPASSSDHLLTCFPGLPTDHTGHGTEMAGLALYGSLSEVLAGSSPVVLRHRLESVKIVPAGTTSPTHPDLYGAITLEAVSRIEVAASEQRRVFSMSITSVDSRDRGQPSSWSAEVDKICFGEEGGEPRLFLVSAGNTPLDTRHEYPAANYTDGIHDPAQSWNALTVSAFTERVIIESPHYRGWSPVAPAGALCPSSTTSLVWEETWPLKPDIVMEGGNCAIDPSTGRADTIEDLSILTTARHPSGRLFVGTGDTSAATALAAKMAAEIQAEYPTYWPETVRGLMVHSAEWTEYMKREFGAGTRSACQNRLRCYGYGVPNLDRALWCARNALTLVAQEELQPFDKEDSKMKTRDMHLYQLPWPVDELRSLGATTVQMRVTLSYFIEPSPGRRGWRNRHRYASHGLRFDGKRPLESTDTFRRRLNQQARDEDEGGSFGSETRAWALGERLRTRGSIHSDWWSGTSTELADCGYVGVVPVIGWWRERPQLERWSRRVRYSLIISITAPGVDVDLYTPVEVKLATPIPTAVEVPAI